MVVAACEVWASDNTIFEVPIATRSDAVVNAVRDEHPVASSRLRVGDRDGERREPSQRNACGSAR
jgi:hypothetical protein